MLPQNVRILRRPHLLPRPRPLPPRRLRPHPPQSPLPPPNLLRPRRRARSRRPAARRDRLQPARGRLRVPPRLEQLPRRGREPDLEPPPGRRRPRHGAQARILPPPERSRNLTERRHRIPRDRRLGSPLRGAKGGGAPEPRGGPHRGAGRAKGKGGRAERGD